MNWFTRLAAAFGLSLVAASTPALARSCGMNPPVVQVGLVAPQPPLPPVFHRPPAPAYNAVWVDGTWQWTAFGWQWQNGYWFVPAPVRPPTRVVVGRGYGPPPQVVYAPPHTRSVPVAPQRPAVPTRPVTYRGR